MKTENTERGFGIAKFQDANGVECSIQKSSVATEDMIWLGCVEIGLKRFVPGQGWHDVDLPNEFGRTMHIANTRMHLTQQQVADLLPYLEHFVKYGELPQPVDSGESAK